VGAGDVLIELDRRPYEIVLREAEARLANAEVDLRVSLLSDADVGADTAGTRRRELAAHRTGYTEAAQNVEQARLDLESTRITAPFDGEVARVAAVAGGQVLSGEGVVTLVDLDRLRVPAEVLETDFGRLERGAGAGVRLAAFPDRRFAGSVTALSPVCDPATGTGVAYVEIANPDRRIRPGMYAEVEIESARYEDRIAVPRAAVLERDKKLLVVGAAAGRAEWEYVTTGLESESLVEITQGLSPGDTVLTAGHLTLAHGAPVRVALE
jgi:membrane fusion protein (multidrug efflux system)